MAEMINVDVRHHLTDVDHICSTQMEFVTHFDRSKDVYWHSAASGTMNCGQCTTCGRALEADRPFLYTDIARGAAIIVNPHGEAADFIRPDFLDRADRPGLRFGQVRGLDAFRELLWMHELDIGAATLGEIKRHLVVRDDYPASAHIRLIGADTAHARFSVAPGGDEASRTAEMPLSDIRKVETAILTARGQSADTRKRRRRFIGRRHPRFVAWLDAVETGGDPHLDACRAGLRAILDGGEGPEDMTVLIVPLMEKSPMSTADAADLFQDLTGIVLSQALVARLGEDEAGKSAMLALWRSFAELPPGLRVRDSLSLEEIHADNEPGQVLAAYIPNEGGVDFDRILLSFDVIQRADFAHALRHEIAHAVHERCEAQINAWLKAMFGWTFYPLPKSWADNPEILAESIDPWIADIGGWADAAPLAVTDGDRQLHRQIIWLACRRGIPEKGVMIQSHLTGPSDQPAWFGELRARAIHLQTGADWWTRADEWFALPVREGEPPRLVFMNYQYSELAIVNAYCRELVGEGKLIPNPFALMSHREFFAEYYASWHDPGSALRDAHPEFEQFLTDLELTT